MMDFQEFDADLEDWNALRASTPITGLLIGNGASRAVWEDFAYDSLFENARTVEEKPLSPSELSVFEALQTRSFEQVLGALKTTSRVNKALAVSSAAPRNRYYAIKEALINTVHAVHIPWRLVQPATLSQINQELRRYRTVFTSNYDLLNYWAIQHNAQGIDDLFRGADPSFDISQTASERTRVLYLHGGLHLVRNQDGTARKLGSTEGTLLGNFAINNTLKTLDDVPLFVSEGPVADKFKTIRGSDYLSFCYQQLLNHSDALCIFGHDLGSQDSHLVSAIRQSKVRTLAISIQPRSKAFIQNQKRRYAKLFAGMEVTLRFFDSKSHALGDPALSVPVER
ncbi:DUF4917 family protein [Pseudomonas chlororaphis]|uniref:DUF4917 family protein n=1 Tax=Pseudomonas chlororaphis TaxID=587753 RepID=UPI0006A5C8F6|nr:DUF4917 family protein [Pseudomonas chlororaphis]AZD00601.1 hypothetical protein C4K27_1390 [Pseudomonas chlororaphis subsp. chlororaphis]MBM0283500.1 DUF4917 family protein [Pseudomonas chlororaphis]MDO1503825.1 DUF4917 family protein [Pseudomonas chlororaphis]ORM48884.1 DUF4917 domain-containing protein [Pseudomonas chlororaphis subsp. chlororaphis]TWR95014.1 DUF4917 family protein [Pseudomonas chlororaphis subsp. chlororaphis]